MQGVTDPEAVADIETALATAATRTAELLRSGIDANARVPGLDWTAGETAAHLVADLREHAALAGGTHTSPPTTSTPADQRSAAERGTAANNAQLEAFTERDPKVLADLMDPAVRQLTTALTGLPADQPIVTANGVPMTPSTLLSICLGEQLIHGLDLARAAGKPWAIDRADALRVIPGLMALVGDYIDPIAAKDVHLAYELRFGRADRYRLAIDGPTATVSPANAPSGASAQSHQSARPDCVITADPAAFLLVGYGRTGQWGPILRGKLRAGGRKPWLAMKFSSLLTNP